MENITEIEVQTLSGTETHIMIDRGNGEFTSMPKSVWDELEAAKEAQSL
jgi:acyl-CoA thioesterase FadM